MPRSAHACTCAHPACRRRPCGRRRAGMKRLRAHRPLPSITIATWRGIAGAFGPALLSSTVIAVSPVEAGSGLDGHDLRLLGRDEAIDLGAMVRSVIFCTSSSERRLVPADLLCPQQPLACSFGIAAHVAGTRCALPRGVTHDLSGRVGSLGQRVSAREAGHPGGRVESRGRTPRSPSRSSRPSLLPHGWTPIARVEQRHVGHPTDRQHRAVILDAPGRGCRGARPVRIFDQPALKVLTERCIFCSAAALISAMLTGNDFRRGTSVPRPVDHGRRRAPGLKIENTLIGSRFGRGTGRTRSRPSPGGCARSPVEV